VLRLTEEIALISLDDEAGKFGQWAAFGIAGAALIELVQEGRVAIAGKEVVVTSAEPTGDGVLDYALARIAESRKTRGSQHWVGAIAFRTRTLRELVTLQLVEKGLVRHEEGRVLWIFRVDRFPEADGRDEDEILSRLRGVLARGETPDEKTTALVALVDACELMGHVLTKQERKEHKARIKQVREGHQLSEAVKAAIQAAQAAAMAATTAATTT